MKDIPLSGIDQAADDEINTCDGRHKGKMREKNHRSNTRSAPPRPSDISPDFQQFPCKQVGTGAIYGMVSVLLYFAFPIYTSVGAVHNSTAFTLAFESARVQYRCWTRAREDITGTPEDIDIKAGRIRLFDGIDHVISDYDSIIHSKESRVFLRALGIAQSSSAPHAHWQNPAEIYMKKTKDIGLSLLNNAGLPNVCQEFCFQHATFLVRLQLPRKRHNIAHKNKTPREIVTGKRMPFKDIKGMAIGMVCWGHEHKAKNRSYLRSHWSCSRASVGWRAV